MRVLITGGAGFIGHNTAIYLKDRGYDVAVFDNLKRATTFNRKRLSEHDIPFIKGDVLDIKTLKDALVGVDVVVHAAAYVSVDDSIRRPAAYFTNNVAGTANTAYVCLSSGVRLIIYLSSAAVYGNPLHLPINEEHPTTPISPYGLSKFMGEEAIKFYSRQGLKYVVLRLFNVYGLGQSTAYAGVITSFVERVHGGKPPIIYGDGEQTRDFIHVYDVAEAIELSMQRGVENEVINIATGKPTSIRELAETVIRLANLNLKPTFARPRLGDIRHSYADISKARKLLGFEPKMSLEEGLKELLRLKCE